MNREKLYLEIGNIDDDLIEEAANTYGHRRYRSRVIRLIGIAACLCLLCIVVVFSQQREVICFNKGGLPVASKLLNASGEDTKLIPIDAQELIRFLPFFPVFESWRETCTMCMKIPRETDMIRMSFSISLLTAGRHCLL